MSNILYHQQLYNEALEYSLKSLDSDVKNQILHDKVYLLLGKIYFSSGNLAKAEEFLLKLVNLQVEAGELVLIKDANLFLSKIYEKRKNNELALKYFQAYNIVNDSLNNSDNARSIERMETRFELQEIEKENKFLKIQQIVDESEIEKTKKQKHCSHGSLNTGFVYCHFRNQIYSLKNKA